MPKSTKSLGVLGYFAGLDYPLDLLDNKRPHPHYNVTE